MKAVRWFLRHSTLDGPWAVPGAVHRRAGVARVGSQRANPCLRYFQDGRLDELRWPSCK
jgi:hypothetical protein